MTDYSVRARGLTRRFGEFVAVDHVSFDIQHGQIWGFLGPNGAGKSTTIRMLCGILDPSEGTAEVLGEDVRKNPEAVKSQIGYMSQKFSLWNDLTVLENLQFYAGVYGLHGRAQDERIRYWLGRLSLGDRVNQLSGTLSGGFRQRLALACSVLHQPRMIFLDEPTAGVNPVSRRTFWTLIDEFARDGATIMVTTHYMDEAEHCDELAFILAGRIIAQGSPDDIRTNQMRGVVVELQTDATAVALTRVDNHPLVHDAFLYGSNIHATVASAQAAQEVMDDLRKSGFPLREARIIPASLEDVFVALVEAQEQGP
ncbi:MAG TPA: ABC transporter ATP-binding protein [Candidatus Xenobia bacterium]